MAQRLSQLATEIWPFLLPKVSNMVGGAASGSSSGAVTVGLHDLSGSLHRGTLADAQAPQFMLTNGSRPLTGDLAVDAGILLDGVDLSAHATDINAHHNKAHGIIDSANHTATGGLQYQVVGLPSAATLGLLTPKSNPGANELIKTDSSSAVTLTGLLYADGGIDFGTNVLDEDATYLQFTGSKAIRFGPNIGNANWTVYNTGQADFGGTVNITGGGDLTVAGSGSYAGNQVLFADSSGGNVGIMRVPDSQFALDVAGPCRAEWFIGPHAIQLKGVLLLAHYDGRAPYESNFSGEPNGHMGQVATVTGGVVFRPGKFYKSVQFAPASNNVVTHPSFELGTLGAPPDGWSFSGAGSFVKSSDVSYYGSYSAKLTVAAQFAYPTHTIVGGINLNSAQTVSAWVWVDSYTSGTLTLSVQRTDTFAEVMQVNVDTSKRRQWQRVSATWPGSGGGTVAARVKLQTSNPATMVAYVDAVQVEPYVYVSPYCDGSLNPVGISGHAWTTPASPHASASTRSAAGIAYASPGNIDPTRGTIMAWVNMVAGTGAAQTVLRLNGSSAGYIILRLDATNKPQAYAGTAAITAGSALTAGAWVHLAMSWDGTNVYLYVNGAYAASGVSSGFSGFGASMYVGCNGASEYFNGMIDDLVILDRAMVINTDNSCDEIRSVYESNAPVFAETSTFTFRPTPKGLIWADDEGLWMRDTAGKPVLGAYGGEAATKNWGGFDLVPGDILLGNNAAGSSAIWWSKVSGTFGFYGNANATAQVEIATDGSLTAGAGKVKLNSTGFHALNASSVATIDIDANGIATGDGGGRTTVASYTSGSRVKWYSVGELYAATPETYLDDSSISRTLYPLVARAIRQGNDAALVEISAVNTSNVGAFLRVGEGFRLKDYFGSPYNTNRVVHASATDIILEATNLQLRSLTTSGSAVGSYSGKIRIQINGTNYYIPYYAS